MADLTPEQRKELGKAFKAAKAKRKGRGKSNQQEAIESLRKTVGSKVWKLFTGGKH